jgi:hypothetical protein
MKYLRFAFVAASSLAGLAYAQDDEQRRAPPVEIPDFSNLDEYIYEPKSTLVIGVRHLSGAKVGFGGGRGQITSLNAPGELDGTTKTRVYQDGAVQPDARTVGRVDENGAPMVNPDTGLQYFDPIPDDGKTNTWNYTSASQLNRQGFIGFRDFSAVIADTTTRDQDSGSSIGVDLAVHRDMGKLFGGRLAWNLTAGVSINDISADTTAGVLATVQTLTDYYRFYPKEGRTLPEAPYSAPSSTTETVLNADGTPVVNPIDGSTATVTTDTTVLLDQQPFERTNTVATNSTSVTNRWKVKGAFYTFRAGPTLWIPITTRLRASVSVGAALVYAGTTYTVTETLEPEVGPAISETEFAEDYKLLPGYYADASLQFDLTERTGFYAGAIYQSSGDYTQVVENATTSYSTKIDLAGLSGFRAGMTVRF